MAHPAIYGALQCTLQQLQLHLCQELLGSPTEVMGGDGKWKTNTTAIRCDYETRLEKQLNSNF